MADPAGHPEPEEIEIGAVLHALADANRRKVVTDLWNAPVGEERTCQSFALPVSKSTLTHHFKILRESGLVWSIDKGNRNDVSLRREDLEARFPGLLKAVVSGSLHPAA
ncbi:ArsR/SmtB family transcription factor [Rugosimonospora africana]|uniref:Transcriptional regulator n=1 Tax=Rugosimonospora africana TaxID=556532 RepID=A0A8J3QUY7_9ACTN|nr:helix-turn-helix domain-containing protein [Rugosimonospora africana]GIH15306.1 transcriptional regulator [Rugosimonospora africana]